MNTRALALAGCLWLTLGAAARVQSNDEALQRGRALYTLGTSPRGAVTARIFGGERVPAATLPCVQCHRADGSGGVEGGRPVPPLTRAALALPRASRGGNERARPAYDRASLARAIRDGLDPGGRVLDELMPRYEMDERDLAELLDSLARLGDEPAPGCDASRVRVGTLLALASARGAAVRLVLEAAFARWNEAGGIHGRRLELVARDCGATGAEARAAADRLLGEDGGVLCLLAPAELGAEPALVAELGARGVPVVGPLAVAPETSEPAPVFWLMASLGDQGRALARHLAETGESAACLDDGSPAAGVLRAALAGALGEGVLLSGTPAELAGRRPARLVCLGPAAWVEEQLAACAGTDWRPRLVLSSVLLGGAPRAEGFGLELLAPALGPGWSAGGERYDALRAGVAPRLAEARAEEPSLRAAYAAVELLAHALRAAGRDLSREGLASALAGVRRLETGVMPPLSFGRTLRVGTRASLLVAYDGGAVTSVQCIEPAPARPGAGE